MIFFTANGDIASTVRMNVRILAIDCKTSACLLPDTPAVLTVGGRTELGDSVVWLANKKLCWILLSGKIVPLSVQQAVPCLCEGGPHTDPNIEVERDCGITTSGNEVRFNVGARPALPAVEPLSVGGVPAADTSVDPSQTTCEWVTQGRHGICLARSKALQRVHRQLTETL